MAWVQMMTSSCHFLLWDVEVCPTGGGLMWPRFGISFTEQWHLHCFMCARGVTSITPLWGPCLLWESVGGWCHVKMKSSTGSWGLAFRNWSHQMQATTSALSKPFSRRFTSVSPTLAAGGRGRMMSCENEIFYRFLGSGFPKLVSSDAGDHFRTIKSGFAPLY